MTPAAVFPGWVLADVAQEPPFPAVIFVSQVAPIAHVWGKAV